VVKIRVEKQIGDSVLSFETGELAKQATSSVLCQYGDTVVLTDRDWPIATGNRLFSVDV